MVSTLVVGLNTYATLAEADAYLEDSARAGAWSFVDSDSKKRALISAFRVLEKLRWAGAKSDVDVAASASVAAGGTGYAVGDVLTVVGGTTGVAAQFTVATLSGSAVATVSLLNVGTYSEVPTNPAATTGGGGSGCTLTIAYADQSTTQPRTGLVDCDGAAVDSTTVAPAIVDAQVELAYEITQDDGIESSPGTGSNVKRAKAGSAEVELFRPTAGTLLPEVAFGLLRCFLASFGGITSPIAGGTDNDSAFTDCDRFNLNEGLS